MTVLHLVALGGTRVGPAVAAAGSVLLARRAGGAFAEVAEASLRGFVRELALGGVAATRSDVEIVVPRVGLTAIGKDLRPLPDGLLDLDIVRVCRLPLGQATHEALRRRLASVRAPDAAARRRCSALLRGEETVLAWRRQAWGRRSALRSRAARAALRPVVFDRDVATETALTGRTSSLADSLDRWLFG